MNAPHELAWVTPSPLWPKVRAGAGAAMARPALLRFGHDRFMESLTEILSVRPEDLAEATVPAGGALKVYQPYHGEHWLVLASLVCQVPGLPEHIVGPEDEVGFVLRRQAGGAEQAWIPAVPPELPSTQPPGALPGAGPTGAWVTLTDPAKLHESPTREQILRLFPLLHVDSTHPKAPRRRKLWGGTVPVGGPDTVAAPPLPAGTAPLWKARLSELLDAADAIHTAGLAPGPAQYGDAGSRAASGALLADLAEFLEATAPGWRTSTTGADLRETLKDLQISRGGGPFTWYDAIEKAKNHTLPDPSDTSHPDFAWRYTTLPSPTGRADLERELGAAGARDTATPSVPLPRLDPVGADRFVLRLVYLRPPCHGRSTRVISGPTHPFTVAPLLDATAPARPIRITLPVDTTIAALRAYPKNVGLILSKKLRNQMAAISPDVLDGEKGSEGSSGLGVIWVFSIPIITIVAMILLMIIATLLNIVFWWLPFLKIAIPVKVEQE